jgi:hypothetical protein
VAKDQVTDAAALVPSFIGVNGTPLRRAEPFRRAILIGSPPVDLASAPTPRPFCFLRLRAVDSFLLLVPIMPSKYIYRIDRSSFRRSN